MKIWTRAYRPWIMGGDVNAPIYTELEPASAPIDLGLGCQVVTVVSPSGKVFVVEVTTGGIVGSSIEQVRGDVATGDAELIAEQQAHAAELFKQAVPVTPLEFWTLLRAN